MLITRDHILAALREIDALHPVMPRSLGYDLLYAGRHYPPVGVMRIAQRLATGLEEWPLPGGTLTNRFLEEAGFTVVSKKQLALLQNQPLDAATAPPSATGAADSNAPAMPAKRAFVPPPARLPYVAEPEAALAAPALSPATAATAAAEPYAVADATADLFLAPDRVAALLGLLRQRQVLVLQGPPGTGKSLLARRLAWLLHGSCTEARTTRLQLHAGYAYEEFVGGYRPAVGGGFVFREGWLTQLAHRAQADPAHPYVLLLDELNRAPVAAVLGEVLSVLPAEARGPAFAVQLATAPPEVPPLWLPANFYLIATMNSADRTLAPLDLALRRRLAFATVPPELGARFRAWLVQRGAPAAWATALAEALLGLNADLAANPTLGAGWQIGHSYFTSLPPEGPSSWLVWLKEVLDHDLQPLLTDLFPDEPDVPGRLLRPLYALAVAG